MPPCGLITPHDGFKIVNEYSNPRGVLRSTDGGMQTGKSGLVQRFGELVSNSMAFLLLSAFKSNYSTHPFLHKQALP